jgi:hypothetical protein
MTSEKHHHRSIDQMNHFERLGALNVVPRDKYLDSYSNTSLGVNTRKGTGNKSLSNKLEKDRSDYRIVSVISLDESILKSSRIEKQQGRRKGNGYKTESSEYSKDKKSNHFSRDSFHPKKDKKSEVQKKAIDGFVKKFNDKNFSNILDYSIINVINKHKILSKI